MCVGRIKKGVVNPLGILEYGCKRPTTLSGKFCDGRKRPAVLSGKFCMGVRDPWCIRKVLCGWKRPVTELRSSVAQKKTHGHGYHIDF